MLPIDESESRLMRQYLEEHCSISMGEEKASMIESRLSGLVLESRCKTFQQFHSRAVSENSDRLKNRIVDAMTSEETCWFRDKELWVFLEEVVAPGFIQGVKKGTQSRVWIAGVSGGQEAYSFTMLLKEAGEAGGGTLSANEIEILGTDSSSAALFFAMSGRYNTKSVSQGLSEARRQKHFQREGRCWILNDDLKKTVKYEQLSLRDSFARLGKFDLILFRYQTGNFSESYRRTLFTRLSEAMKRSGILLLGLKESLEGLSDKFEVSSYKGWVVNRLK